MAWISSDCLARGTAGCRVSVRAAAWLLLAAGLTPAGATNPVHADESPAPMWGDVLLATPEGAILPRSLRGNREITSAFIPPDAGGRAMGDARGALMNFDGVVLIAIVTLADHREEAYHVPRTTGDDIDIYNEQVILGGTVVALQPLTQTVLTTAPILGVRRLLLQARPSEARVRDEAMHAASAFAHVAQQRGETIGTRSRQAAIRRRTFGAPLLDAGRSDGVQPGLQIPAVDRDTATGVLCAVRRVNEHDSELECSGPPSDHAVGRYLRSDGRDVAKYQVLSAAITSPKAQAVLAQSLAADEVMVAFAASDQLAARGCTVLPPGGQEGLAVLERAILEFEAAHGVADSLLKTFSLGLSPDHQVTVLVDGYNTAVVHGAGVKRRRIHKAWATVTDDHGHGGQGIGVAVVDEIEDWQEEAPQTADAREAIINAVKCATGRLVGEESKECE